MISVKINILDKATKPEYKSTGSAGADLYSFIDSDITIEPGKTALIPTGVLVEIPEGYEAQIRPRSGLAFEHGLTVLNSPGTIDSDYRGEIKIIMINLSGKAFVVKNNMRIAQMIFARVYRAEFLFTDNLNSTERGTGGFGHTGV